MTVTPAMLILTLEITRDVLDRHAPDFEGRDTIVCLLHWTVALARAEADDAHRVPPADGGHP